MTSEQTHPKNAFVAANEWEVSRTEEGVLWVLGPTGSIMNSIQPGAQDALREYFKYPEGGTRVDDMPEEVTEDGSPRRAPASAIDASWIGERVRVRVGTTLIVEDALTQVTHFAGNTQMYFQDTKRYKGGFMSGDDGYRVDRDEWVEVIP